MRRYIAFLLIACLAAALVSCGKGVDDSSSVSQTSGTVVTDVIQGETDTFVSFDNPEVDEYVDTLAASYDFKGSTFTWCGNEGQAPDPEEETGDIRNDALYYRQRQIEETFDIVWHNYRPDTIGDSMNQPVYDHVMQDVLAGNGAFDLCYGTTIAIAQPLFLKDALSDLSGYECLDLDREWWTPGLWDSYSINGAIYFLNGAIVTSNYEDTWCVAFNKDIATDYGIEGLYDLVYNDEWTFDRMLEVASVIPSNENGSGVYRYGNADGMSTMYAHGFTLGKFDENGRPYVDQTIPRELYDLMEKYSAIYSDETVSAICKGGLKGHYEWVIDKFGYEDFNEMFAKNEFFFYFLTTGEAAWLRTYDVEFGILPIPKGDNGQKEYISHTHMWGASNVFVPKSSRNTTMSDVMLEALASLGYKYIKPAYYDKILKTRATYDVESKEMIDIVFESKHYDIIDFLAVGGNINMESDFVRMIRCGMQERTDSMASRYVLQAMIVNRNIETILKNIEAERDYR